MHIYIGHELSIIKLISLVITIIRYNTLSQAILVYTYRYIHTGIYIQVYIASVQYLRDFFADSGIKNRSKVKVQLPWRTTDTVKCLHFIYYNGVLFCLLLFPVLTSVTFFLLHVFSALQWSKNCGSNTVCVCGGGGA